jgi:iron(III) transport system substrate-binding protein
LRTILASALAIIVVALWLFGRADRDALVVYCAHDAVFSESILRDFEKRTGIRVAARYDTEATKSLGLVELLVRETSAPRCDVFWNNELLGTLDLAQRGLLTPYRGAGWERIPARYRDPEGRWTGFAARLRVHILNTERLPTDTARPTELTSPNAAGTWHGAAIAKPLYGTTLTHYSLLWQRWGGDELKRWHTVTRADGLREVNGNGAVKQIVATGVCAHGLTDTDDFFDAQDSGAPVAMRPVALASGETICIPNTVAIVHGTRRENAARQLVDFLLSAETELALARSKARQIPLGDVPSETLPPEVAALLPAAAKGADLTGLLQARTECLAWLKSVYTE